MKHRPRPGSRGPVREYRVTATWPARTGRSLVYRTADRARARAVARGRAADGAHVTIEEHQEYGVYRTIAVLDGPALLAARVAAERDAAVTARAAQEATDARLRAEQADRAQERREYIRRARERAQAAALMVQPPVPRPDRRTARHTAGERR